MFPILQFVSAVKCPMPPWFEPKSVVGNWDFTSALAREYKDEIKYTCPEGYVFQVCMFLSFFYFTRNYGALRAPPLLAPAPRGHCKFHVHTIRDQR